MKENILKDLDPDGMVSDLGHWEFSPSEKEDELV